MNLDKSIESKDIKEVNWNTDGSLSFEHNGKKYWTDFAAQRDNVHDRVAYVANLTAYDEELEDEDRAGEVVWEIVNPDSDDEADACDWDDFTVYFS